MVRYVQITLVSRGHHPDIETTGLAGPIVIQRCGPYEGLRTSNIYYIIIDIFANNESAVSVLPVAIHVRQMLGYIIFKCNILRLVFVHN